jgi:hypothetical protein
MSSTGSRINACEVVIAQWPGLNRCERYLLGLGRGMWRPIWLVTTAREHRSVVLDGTDIAWMVGPILDGGLEYDPLVVAFALALRLDAVTARRSLLAAFDPAFSTSEAAGLGPFSHLVCRVSCLVAGWGHVASTTCWRSDLGVRHAAKA